MKTPVTLAAVGATPGVAFAPAYGAGAAVDPIAARTSVHGRSTDAPASTRSHTPPGRTVATPGLLSSEAGYTLVAQATTLPRAANVQFAFTVNGPNGRPVAA